MIITMSKDKPGDELFIKFTLPNNHFIIFNAKELTDTNGLFKIEFTADHDFRHWLNNRFDKSSVDPAYYEQKV